MDQSEVKIRSLTKKKKYDKAIEYVRSNNTPIDPFIVDFKPLIDEFSEKPSFKLALTIVSLFHFPVIQGDARDLLILLKKTFFLTIYDFMQRNLRVFIRKKEFRPITEFIIHDEVEAQKFLVILSEYTEEVVKNPHNKEFMGFLLYLNETFQEIGNKDRASEIHGWISAILDLRKSSPITANLIRHIFKTTRGMFAPISLFKTFFEEIYKKFNNRASPELCNQLSEFMQSIVNILYEHPDNSIKGVLLELINNYTDTIASAYEPVLFDRMRTQNVGQILNLGKLGPAFVVSNLLKNISIPYSSAFTRCLRNLVKRWEYFPILLKLTLEPNSIVPGFTFLKPIFWFSVFQLIFLSHFEKTYRFLPKSEVLHHNQLKELVRGYIDFLFLFRECIRTDISLPYEVQSSFFDQTVHFLKKSNEMIHFSNEELEELVKTSHWRMMSRKIFAKIIEAKNYCIYCNYNMPPGSKLCPNCSKEVTDIAFDTAQVDLDAMAAFFSSSSQSGGGSLTGSTCPRCGALLSQSNRSCNRCGFQIR